jgi:hypothetical protein
MEVQTWSHPYLKREHDDLSKPDRMAIKGKMEPVFNNEDVMIGTVIKYSWQPKFGNSIYRNW